MANLKKRVLENVEGEFFVDSTCIDCDTCRQLAPEIFEDSGNNSFVKNQPEGPAQTRAAMQALLACPTGSIGTLHPHPIQEVMKDFPVLIEEDVYYCGFNSPQSFGGNSYFIKHAQGNWLIDSPKFLPHLVRQFEERGGVRYIFLTHQDDVADAATWSSAGAGILTNTAPFLELTPLNAARGIDAPVKESVFDGITASRWVN